MEQQSLNFKQLYYTHASQGIYGKNKGWQVVGVSAPDRDYFQPLLQKYFSVLSIPEAMRLKEKFTLYSMQLVNKVPVLIRIVDAGLTVESRPGNIFAHALVLEESSRAAFYKCDALSLLTQWDGWQDKLEGSPDANLAPLSLPVAEFADETAIQSAKSYLENTSGTSATELLNRVVCAGSLALNARSPQYLIIHPANGSHPERGVDLFRVIWSWTPIALRKRVSFWIGRNSLKMPGFNWLILSESDRKLLSPQTLGRSAFGFDLRHNGFTQENILKAKSDENISDMNITAEAIQERNQRSDILENFFGYEGTNGRKISGLMNAYKQHQADVFSDEFCREAQNILSEFDRKDQPDEYIYVFNSLIHLTGTLADKGNKITPAFIDTAFKIDYSGSKMQKLLQVLLPCIKTLLLNSLDWKVPKTGENYQSFLNEIFDKLRWFKAPESKCSPQALWADIIQDAETSPRAWQLLKLLLNWHIRTDARILKNLQSTSYKSKVEWLNSKDFGMFEADSEQFEKQWYKKLYKMLTTATRQDIMPFGETDGLIIELYESRPEDAEDSNGKLLINYVANSPMGENEQVRCWTRLYDSAKEDDQEKIRRYYFDCINRIGPTSQPIDKDNTLLPYFHQQNHREFIRNEIAGRLSKYTTIVQPQYAPEGYRETRQQQLTDANRTIITNYFKNLLRYAEPPQNGISDMPSMLEEILRDKKEFRVCLTLALAEHLTERIDPERTTILLPMQQLLRFLSEYNFCFRYFLDWFSMEQMDKVPLKTFRIKLMESFLEYLSDNLALEEELQKKFRKWAGRFKLSEVLTVMRNRIKKSISEKQLTYNDIVYIASIIGPINSEKPRAFYPEWTDRIITKYHEYPVLLLFKIYFETQKQVDVTEHAEFEFLIRFLSIPKDSFDSEVKKLLSGEIIQISTYQGNWGKYLTDLKFVINLIIQKAKSAGYYTPIHKLSETLFQDLESALKQKSDNNFSWEYVAQIIAYLRNHKEVPISNWTQTIDLRILSQAENIFNQHLQIDAVHKYLQPFYNNIDSINRIDPKISQIVEKFQEGIIKQIINVYYQIPEHQDYLAEVAQFFCLLDYFKDNLSKAKKLIDPKANYDFKALLKIFQNAKVTGKNINDITVNQSFALNRLLDKVLNNLILPEANDTYKKGGWKKFADIEDRPLFYFLECFFDRFKRLEKRLDRYSLLEIMIRGHEKGLAEKLACAIMTMKDPHPANNKNNDEVSSENQEVSQKSAIIKKSVKLFYRMQPSKTQESYMINFLERIIKFVEKEELYPASTLRKIDHPYHTSFKYISEAIYAIVNSEPNYSILKLYPQALREFICIDLYLGRTDLFDAYLRNMEENAKVIEKLLKQKVKKNSFIYDSATVQMKEFLKNKKIIKR